MRTLMAHYASVTGILLWIGTARSANASTTYEYIGSPFTTCTYGSCPGNFTSDYIIASISFAAPLAPNQPETDEYAALTAWTIGDALGNFFYSSTNPATASYLTGVPQNGLPPLELSTSGGNIVDYEMSSFPAGVLGMFVASDAALFNPPPLVTGGYTAASWILIDYGSTAGWNAITSIAGTWTAVPEPSSLVLTGLSGIILLIAMRRKRRTLWSSDV